MLASALAGCAGRSTPVSAPGPLPIDTLALRLHTRVLAHDSLGGRGTGSDGLRSAALYIARRLRSLGLRPLQADGAVDDDDYLVPVPLQRADVSLATLTVGDTELSHGMEFVVGRIGRDGLGAASGSVVPLGADSADVTPGSWVLLQGSLGEAASRWLPGWRARGVAGLIVRLPSDAAVAGYHAQLGDIRWQLREGPADPIWQPALPVVMVGPGLAARMAEPGTRVTFEPHAAVRAVTDHNVVGVLDSSAPTGEHGAIVLTAHYDHLGTVSGLRGDSIYNGFSDNAAGVAMLLAIAQSASASPPPRPLVFLFPAAEEVGLLGSIHFVRTHPDLVEDVHALVNLDAGAPPAPPTRWRLAAATRSPAGAVAAAVVDTHAWTHRSDAGSPNSDHWPFVARGVPAVFLIPDGGYEGVDAAGERSLTERWDRYHRPDDEWAADFPFTGLERYATLALEIVYALATAALGQ